MTVWAIGDLQGCYDTTQRLLERIAFDPAVDRLWFCGDLVNRGGQSLETLRLVHSLREQSVVVLGNHDLSLLAIGQRSEEEQRKVNIDLQRVVTAPDRDELLDWLRGQKLMHVDRTLGWAMLHAGIAPKWTIAMAERHAREVEERLRSDQYGRMMKNLYGDGPLWNPRLAGTDRLRAIINIFTRMRFCSPRGRIGFDDKGAPGTQSVGMYPWYAVPGHAPRDLKIVCGHWSALGLFIGQGVHAIDTGAVWGGKLTALQLDTDELRVVQVPGRDVPAPQPKSKPSNAQRERDRQRQSMTPRSQGTPPSRPPISEHFPFPQPPDRVQTHAPLQPHLMQSQTGSRSSEPNELQRPQESSPVHGPSSAQQSASQVVSQSNPPQTHSTPLSYP